MRDEQLCVLLIDDAILLRDRLADYLRQRYAYQVVTATTEEAFSYVEASQGLFDVALIDDLVIPQSGFAPEPVGIKLMEKIKAHQPSLECILLTERGLDTRLAALRAGAYRYLAKPCNPDELAVLIQAAAEQSKIRRERDILSITLEISRELTSHLDIKTAVQMIVDAVPRLVGAAIGTVVLIDTESGRLDRIRSTPLGDTAIDWRRHLRDRELTKAIIATGEMFYVTDVDAEPNVTSGIRQSGIKSFIGVPIPGKMHNLGVLYAYSTHTYAYAPYDQKVLELLAGQAAVALRNAQLYAEATRERDRAEFTTQQLLALHQIASEMQMQSSLPTLLNTIARQATALLKADAGGILLLDAEKRHLQFHGAFGLSTKMVAGTRDLIGGSIAGRVVATGEAIIANDVKHDVRFYNPAADGEELLAIMSTPLCVRGEIIGTLDVHSKTKPWAFNLTDLDILALFANQAAIAYEHASLVSKQTEQTNHLQRLVSSSPAGIISLDKDGNITSINEKTEEMLGYTNDSLQGKPVTYVYADPQESHHVGRLLHQAQDGRIQGHATFLQNVHGQSIPIRLAATWLYDSQGRQIGSVGYFEDLRSIQATENRLELLLKASNLVAQADNLDGALQRLAQLLVDFLDTTYCRISLLQEDKQILVAEAAYASLERDNLQWKPSLHQKLKLEQMPRWAKFLELGKPSLLRVDHPEDQPYLIELSKWRGFNTEIQSLFMVPLRSGDNVVGLLALGELRNWALAPISAAKAELAVAIAHQTAALVDRIWLYERNKTAREQIQAFYEASNTLISGRSPNQVLKDIINQVRMAARAAWVSIILINDFGQAQDLIMDGINHNFITANRIRPNGISKQVMHSGEPYIIEDAEQQRAQINPIMFEHQIRAALCLPFSLRGKQSGVMWIHYQEARHFPQFEVQALQLYVNQACIAYDNARRMAELEHLRQAAQHLAEATDVQGVLEQIVQDAQQILHADSAAIWSYDAERHKFISNHSVAAGIPPEVWAEFRKAEPQLGQTASTVVQQGWINVEALDRQRYPFLGESTKQLLSQIGVKSFAGITLKVGDEELGVLYINYNHPYKLSLEEHEMAQTFANQAALALKKAKLLNQINNVRNVAKIVADVTVLENLDNTLALVASETKNALDCDAVTLFVYDQEKDSFRYPSNVVGVNFPEKASRHIVSHRSIVHRMLACEQPYIAEDVSIDPIFLDRSFVQREAIASCIATSLTVGHEKVGVMFVNYRMRHRFTGDEITNIQLFANQAAVAIRNAQLYEKSHKRANDLQVANARLERHNRHQQAVYAASKVISGEIVTEPRQLLERILEQAVERIKPARAPKCILGAIQLYEAATNTIHVECIYPIQAIYAEQNRAGQKRPLNGSQGRIGISGRAILECKAQRVADVTQDPDYLNFYASTKAQLSVPILEGEQVVGVLSLESDQVDAFDAEDEQAIQALAELAVIAIQNSRRYQELRQTKILVSARTALAWMGMANNTWRHSIEKHALTIREQTELLRRQLKISAQAPVDHKLAHNVDERLSMIERLAHKISEKPINPPLSAEEGASSLLVNQFIEERAQQLWRNSPYKLAHLELKLHLHHEATVWGSREWLRRAFDILVENAVNAVSNTPEQKITISTSLNEQKVEILVADTGVGIPHEVRQKIGMEFIEKPEDAKGLGMGLLMAQTIVQTYSGEIHVAKSGPEGTVMLISLPLEEQTSNHPL